MDLINKVRQAVVGFISGKRPSGAPIIQTQFGPVTEGARLLAARNMRENPETKAAVEELLCKQLGNVALGLAEARRRYPEAYK